MNPQRTKIRQFCVIPWDLGRAIGPHERDLIYSRLSQFSLRRKSLRHNEGLSTSLFFTHIDGFLLLIDFFSDGICHFLLVSKSIVLKTKRDFDPDTLNYRKWSLSNDVLSISSRIGLFLFKIRKSIWSALSYSTSNMRTSANAAWENFGLSYTFSFFLIKTRPLEETKLIKLLPIVLFPRKIPFSSSSAVFEDTASIVDRQLSGSMRDICLHDANDLKVWYSWSAAVILCNDARSEWKSYIGHFMEIQHVWFFIFSISKRFDEISGEISKFSKISDITKLDEEIARMHFAAFRVKHMNKSMMSEDDVKMQMRLWEYSRLNVIYEELCEKSEMVRRIVEGIINVKRAKRQQILEILIAILAFLQGFSAYTAFKNATDEYIIDIFAFGILFIIYLFVSLRN